MFKTILAFTALAFITACGPDPAANCRTATYAVIGAQFLHDEAAKYAAAHPNDTTAQDHAAALQVALDGALATKAAVCAPPAI